STAGYEFFKYLAVEGSFGRSGEIRGTVPIVVPGRGTLNFDISAEYDIGSVRAVGFVPVGKKVRCSAASECTTSGSARPASRRPSRSSAATRKTRGLGLMLGVQFDFGHVALRARYETYNTESNLDLADFGVGLSVRF